MPVDAGRLPAWSGVAHSEQNLADGGFTAKGRDARETIEAATDGQMAGAISALGADFDELIALMTPWCQAIRDGQGYPASGPHDLANITR